MTECMIDIETLSTLPNATILTIGAIKFNRKDRLKPINELETFYCRVTLDSCKKKKMHIDSSTQKWWKTQSKEAQHEAIYHTDRIPLKEGLIELWNFFQGCDKVWANSP